MLSSVKHEFFFIIKCGARHEEGGCKEFSEMVPLLLSIFVGEACS